MHDGSGYSLFFSAAALARASAGCGCEHRDTSALPIVRCIAEPLFANSDLPRVPRWIRTCAGKDLRGMRATDAGRGGDRRRSSEMLGLPFGNLLVRTGTKLCAI